MKTINFLLSVMKNVPERKAAVSTYCFSDWAKPERPFQRDFSDFYERLLFWLLFKNVRIVRALGFEELQWKIESASWISLEELLFTEGTSFWSGNSSQTSTTQPSLESEILNFKASVTKRKFGGKFWNKKSPSSKSWNRLVGDTGPGWDRERLRPRKAETEKDRLFTHGHWSSVSPGELRKPSLGSSSRGSAFSVASAVINGQGDRFEMVFRSVKHWN